LALSAAGELSVLRLARGLEETDTLPMRVLYVENHARFAKLTVAQFLASHEVTVVPSVAAARQALAQSAFDAVLVDYDLDDGKGDELVKWLQAQSPRPFVVAVSSHQVGNDALVAAGADVVCSKMQFSNIESVLTQLLESGG
jgi:DNA-binding response OmpR family regulator